MVWFSKARGLKWRFPKIGVPHSIIHVYFRISNEINHPAWGSPMTMETSESSLQRASTPPRRPSGRGQALQRWCSMAEADWKMPQKLWGTLETLATLEYIWRFPEIGVPHTSMDLNGIFSIVSHPLGSYPIYGNPHIYIHTCMYKHCFIIYLKKPWIPPQRTH